MEELQKLIPPELFDFAIITILSLIIGLSQKKLHAAHVNHHDSAFGTDRTFAFLGMLGYVFWIADSTHILFLAGLATVSVLFSINYFQKISHFQDFGFTSIITGLLTFNLVVLLKTQPFWLFLLVYVTMLTLTELKEALNKFSQKVNREEFITLGKFIAIAGIVLPMVPNTPIVPYLDITPYKIWLAVVIISSISYLSYLLRKFIFKDAGILLTGILGGLYSSTATTVVLARSSKHADGYAHHFAASIILATAMMYLRVAVLLAIFNMPMFMRLWPWFLVMVVVTSAVALVYLKLRKEKTVDDENLNLSLSANPLEFRIAIIFTLLFVAFSFITYFTIQRFGSSGLQALAYIVGVADIDPFLLNLFQGRMVTDPVIIGAATFQAMLSNNILKTVYGLTLSGKSCKRLIIVGMGIVILVNFIIVFLI